VADVRRWCLAGAQAKLAASAPTGESDSSELGYEAAYPTLQSRHWPDAPGGTRTDLR
jgi:hypothetical protein